MLYDQILEVYYNTIQILEVYFKYTTIQYKSLKYTTKLILQVFFRFSMFGNLDEILFLVFDMLLPTRIVTLGGVSHNKQSHLYIFKVFFKFKKMFGLIEALFAYLSNCELLLL